MQNLMYEESKRLCRKLIDESEDYFAVSIEKYYKIPNIFDNKIATLVTFRISKGEQGFEVIANCPSRINQCHIFNFTEDELKTNKSATEK